MLSATLASCMPHLGHHHHHHHNTLNMPLLNTTTSRVTTTATTRSKVHMIIKEIWQLLKFEYYIVTM